VPDYLAPGVSFEEVSFRAKSIEGVNTSTTGFVGTVAEGPLGVAVHVRSFAEYQWTFGGLHHGSDLAHAVQLFFANGGGEAWIVGVPSDGSPAERLPALDAAPDLALLCLPGEADRGVLGAALQYAERRRVFLILDPPGPDLDAAVALARELAGTGNANGAVYFPPVRIADPLEDGRERACPPSGAVAGMYARNDASRGVWKAPAGLEAVLLGVRDVEVVLEDADVGALKVVGVNGIRMLPGVGSVVWGARTIQGADEGASEWKYVPVRRLAMYIEESLYRGTQWVVSEPNDEPLWARLRLAAGAFLEGLFRAGAFQGRTPQEAYFVRCDRSTMTHDDLDNGVVRVVVGFAPLKPAEFVVMQIEQRAARGATEQLGPGTGEPRQEISLARCPMWREGFILLVEGQLGWTAWRLVEELEGCGPDDPVFTLDAEAGVIRFGDSVNGAIPPAGAGIEASYRYGSGRGGEPESQATRARG
jgi:phage tail sheath protein FI